jgi:hypothetical protein
LYTLAPAKIEEASSCASWTVQNVIHPPGFNIINLILRKIADCSPVQPKTVPTTQPRSGESQVDATRRTLRATGPDASALNAINAANSAIDAQTRPRRP